MDWLVEELWKEVSMAFSGLNLQNLFWVSRPANKTKHIKNATWPERCGQRNKKTRKRENRENQKTGTLLAVFAFSRCSRLRASLIASLIDCRFCCLMQTRLSCFRRFRVYRVLAVFAVFAFSGFRCSRRFRRFRRFQVFAFSCSQVDSSRVRVFVLSHVRSWRFRATEFTVSVHTLHMPKAVRTFMFNVYGMDCWHSYT